ncbi:ExeA family protein [Deefgea rivuli]|uniref:ExeA family protein n=1 Tax=Deefgea rivuli TaxID=400948 RepID=UPI00146FA450|nr:AAA family ATPase [Deefgea rivuli]
MYLAFFGLKSPPFRLTAHPDFFFSGAGRGALLDALLYAIESGEGLIKVTAEVGAGKTMLCRMLLERLPQKIDAIFLPNPLLREDELLLTLADELQIEFRSDRATQKIRLIEEALIAKYAAGRQVVLLIDEAHAMPDATLELIRLLSNLDAGHHKLLQIVLFAQPELDEKLKQTELRALRERVSYSLNLPLLNPAEVGDYLSCRLFAAGHTGNAIFSAAAVEHIATVAQGLSRRVNVLADKALLAAFAESAPVVSVKHAKLAEIECDYQSPSSHKKYAVLALLALLFVAAYWHFYPRPASSTAQVSVSPPSVELNVLASHAAVKMQAMPFSDLLLLSRQKLIAAEASSVTVLVSKIPRTQNERLQLLVAEIEARIGPGRVIVYPTRSKGVLAWGVLAGLYPDRQHAQLANIELLQGSKLRGTQVQTIGVLRDDMLLSRD